MIAKRSGRIATRRDDWTLFEAAPDAVGVTGTDGGLIFVNRQLEGMVGYGRAELRGNPIEILMPDRFRAGHNLLRDRYLASPRLRDMGTGLDLFGCRKDGSEFPIDVRFLGV